MTNSLIEVDKCECCDTHILSIDSSLLREGLQDEEGNAFTGMVSIADLTPEECWEIINKGVPKNPSVDRSRNQ